MQIIMNDLSPLFEKTAGLFIFCLLIADTIAFLIGFVLVLFFRIRSHRENTYRKFLKDDIRIRLEKLLGGENLDQETLIEQLKRIPDADKASLFLEYSRMVSGHFHERIILIFRRAGLAEWVKKSSSARQWWKRLWAVRAIEVLEKPEAIEIIRRQMLDTKPLIRLSAVQMVVLFPEDVVIREILEILVNEHGMARFVMKDTFIRIGTTGSQILLEFLNNTQVTQLVIWAIEVAGEIKDPIFVESILNLLLHGNGEVRAASARALSSFPEQMVINALVNALKDEEEEVRAMAANSLGRIRDEETVRDIIGAFSDASWMVRLNCAIALKRMGKKGSQALIGCMKHSDRYVADMARHVESLPDYSINWAE